MHAAIPSAEFKPYAALAFFHADHQKLFRKPTACAAAVFARQVPASYPRKNYPGDMTPAVPALLLLCTGLICFRDPDRCLIIKCLVHGRKPGSIINDKRTCHKSNKSYHGDRKRVFHGLHSCPFRALCFRFDRLYPLSQVVVATKGILFQNNCNASDCIRADRRTNVKSTTTPTAGGLTPP